MTKIESKAEYDAKRGFLHLTDGDVQHFIPPERIVEVTGYMDDGKPFVDVYVDGIDDPLSLDTVHLDDVLDAWAAARRKKGA